MAEKVIIGHFNTTLDIDAERVLKTALESDLEHVTIIAHCRDGSQYIASTFGDYCKVNFELDLAKKFFLDYDVSRKS